MYVLSTTNEFQSHWMIFDVTNQEWTQFPNKINFIVNCCQGKLVTVRGGFHYFFHKLHYSILEDESPIYRIHENGTTVDFDIGERPFAKEYEEMLNGFVSFSLAPFYQRFYKKGKYI